MYSIDDAIAGRQRDAEWFKKAEDVPPMPPEAASGLAEGGQSADGNLDQLLEEVLTAVMGELGPDAAEEDVIERVMAILQELLGGEAPASPGGAEAPPSEAAPSDKKESNEKESDKKDDEGKDFKKSVQTEVDQAVSEFMKSNTSEQPLEPVQKSEAVPDIDKRIAQWQDANKAAHREEASEIVRRR